MVKKGLEALKMKESNVFLGNSSPDKYEIKHDQKTEEEAMAKLWEDGPAPQNPGGLSNEELNRWKRIFGMLK